MENKVNTAKVNYYFKINLAKEIKGVIAREEKRLPGDGGFSFWSYRRVASREKDTLNPEEVGN